MGLGPGLGAPRRRAPRQDAALLYRHLQTCGLINRAGGRGNCHRAGSGWGPRVGSCVPATPATPTTAISTATAPDKSATQGKCNGEPKPRLQRTTRRRPGITNRSTLPVAKRPAIPERSTDVCAAVVLIVKVVVTALAPGVTVAGANVQAASEGRPLQAKVTGCAKPPEGVTETVVVPLWPDVMERLPGLAPSLKEGGTGACTVTSTAVEVEAAKLLSPPYCAVMLCAPVARSVAAGQERVRGTMGVLGDGRALGARVECAHNCQARHHDAAQSGRRKYSAAEPFLLPPWKNAFYRPAHTYISRAHFVLGRRKSNRLLGLSRYPNPT
jgi:hypothetical protein